MPRASEPDSHPSEWRTGLGRSGGGGRLGSMLLSAGSDVTFDPSPAEGAEIGCRAVAGIGRYLVGIASEVRLDAIEQRRKVWLITAVVTERVRHDDLIIRIHCSLRVVALDVAVLGLESLALGDSVKLRCAFGSGSCDGGAALRPGPGLSSFFSRAACAACALAFASASSSALASRIRTKRVCLSATQSGSSSPRIVRPERLVLRGVRRFRRVQPAVDLRLQLSFALLHILVTHRLVLGRIRLDLGAVERHGARE